MPISQYFSTPSELVSLLKMKYLMKVPTIPDEENLKYCYTILITVSRSFAAVIQELPDELRHPVSIDCPESTFNITDCHQRGI